MLQLVLKNKIENSKLEALMAFLKLWDIDAEIKEAKQPVSKRKQEFTLATGIWKDNEISVSSLRKQAWSRNK